MKLKAGVSNQLSQLQVMYIYRQALKKASNFVSQTATKILPERYEEVSEILGISAVFINDMKYRRVSDYKFDWDRIMKINGETGIALQYSYARLCK